MITLALAAAPATVAIGQTGEWVGPLLVGLAAGALDYSALGSSSIRDRFAVAGYYACVVSMAAILGWTGYIRGEVRDYNWQMIGAIISLVTHGALLFAMFGHLFGPTRALAKVAAKRVKMDSNESAAVKINSTLLGWTVTAGLAAPLSGDDAWGRFVDGIALATTSFWSVIVTWIFERLGG